MKPPLPNSYWVEPGQLLAGEHPDGGSFSVTQERITALIRAGITMFLDLTQDGELPEYRSMLPAGTGYASVPIVDHSVPDSPEMMRRVQQLLADSIGAGGAVYLHCRAGIGRTGVAVGCYLREQGAAPDAALERLNLPLVP